MKTIGVIGILIGLVGFVGFGAIYWGLYGGIKSVIEAIQEDPIPGGRVAWGAIRALIIAGPLATIGIIVAWLGGHFLMYDDKRGF